MNNEQRMQLDHVIDALAADLYHPLGTLSFEGFRAAGELTPEEAAKRKRRPYREGEHWGEPRSYAWFFAEFTLPEEARGERVVMDLNPGGESTVFLDGKPFGTRRGDSVAHPHHYIVDQTVSLSAEPGERHTLALEAYAGTPLPAHPGRPVFPEEGVGTVRDRGACLGHSTFGIWNEQAYQLWLDLDMLRDLYGFLPEHDAMREQISAHVGRLLDRLDLEQPLKQRRAACSEAREWIAPVMRARNGTFAPAMGVIGNSHLDLAWLWPLGETRRKTARTFAAQLRLLKEYPEALFLHSQCAEYEMCRRAYPDLFREVKEAIAGGRWIAEGGMWVEPDTNLSGGEALVRQILYGRRYFREVLGVESEVIWLPDTFGYTAALPQIIRGFGMKGLTTQKIFWSYNDSEPFPHHAFLWKGLDGSTVPAYLHMFYETQVDAATLHTRWTARVDRDGSGDFYLPFGYGDGGGGPTRDDMEQIRRQKDLQGSPRLYWCTPGDYLDKRAKDPLPVYRGELYFPCHRGTYTTQAAVKRGNRQCEAALRAWEMAAARAGRAAYPAEALEKAWKTLLINQFHDILPGSAIAEVYREARKDHESILAEADRGLKKALAACRRRGGRGEVTCVNPGTRGGFRLLTLPEAFAAGARDEAGNLYPAEARDGKALVRVSLPALGGITLRPAEAPACEEVCLREEKDGFLFRNAVLTAKVSREGELLSLRKGGREYVHSPSNRFRLYRDLPRRFDAWDIDSQTENREVFPERSSTARIVKEKGLYAAVEVETRLGSSLIRQTVSLSAGDSKLLFDTEVSWQERHRLLKVSFDTGIDVPEASHQIQFGYLDRPAHRSRKYDADRFEVCCHAWTALHDAGRGAAVLNDCKYGVSVCDGVISLSLLRAPTYPDAEADRGSHHFRYACYVWDGPFGASGINGAAEELNVPVTVLPGRYSLPSLLTLSDPCITVESVKLAEDGSGDTVVRLFEDMGGTRDVTLTPGFPFRGVCLCDLEEKPLEEPETENGAVRLPFRPFEIKTLRFRAPG